MRARRVGVHNLQLADNIPLQAGGIRSSGIVVVVSAF